METLRRRPQAAIKIQKMSQDCKCLSRTYSFVEVIWLGKDIKRFVHVNMKIWFDKNNLYLIADIKQNLKPFFLQRWEIFLCASPFICMSELSDFSIVHFPILITCVTLHSASSMHHSCISVPDKTIQAISHRAVGLCRKTIPSGTRLFLDQNHISNNTASFLKVMNKSRTVRHNKKQFKWLWCYCRVCRFVSLICLNVKSYICLSMSVCCSLRRLQWGLFQRCG